MEFVAIGVGIIGAFIAVKNIVPSLRRKMYGRPHTYQEVLDSKKV